MSNLPNHGASHKALVIIGKPSMSRGASMHQGGFIMF